VEQLLVLSAGLKAIENTHHANKTKQSLLRSEVFAAVTTKNAVFWDIKTQFIPHRKRYRVQSANAMYDLKFSQR
jgi:hypothetical protein